MVGHRPDRSHHFILKYLMLKDLILKVKDSESLPVGTVILKYL